MWLGDEAGDYPDAIMPTFEGIFAGEPAEAHIAIAGNPTKLGGPLYRARTTAEKLWYVVEITGDPDDPRRSSRISLQHAREQIEEYGRDNPWVVVNIFGQFPPSSLNALIGPDEVERRKNGSIVNTRLARRRRSSASTSRGSATTSRSLRRGRGYRCFPSAMRATSIRRLARAG